MQQAKQHAKWSHPRVLLMCALPAALSLVGVGLAECVPSDAVWGHLVHAIGWMAPRWLMLLTPFWCLRVSLASGRRWAPAVVSLLALPLVGLPLGEASGPGLRVLVGNVNAYTAEPEGLAAAIAETRADVVIQVEARAFEIPGYTLIADNRGDVLPRPSHASAVFCRQGVACEGAVSEQFGSRKKKMPVALARLPDGVCVFGMHAPPPVPLDATGLQPHMERVASYVNEGVMARPWGPCQRGDPVVIAGDFNAVPGSWATRALSATGLRDHLAHWGLFALSWPFGGDILTFPVFQLDHLFVGQVHISGVEFLRLPGADHRAILMTVAANSNE
jgi:endonuclease/exonuclease/phosphatase (EEP) superfamily protein YafD